MTELPVGRPASHPLVAAAPVNLSPSPSLRRRIGDYLLLTKPWIVSLLLLTTFCGMVVGAGRLPGLQLVLVTLLGGALTAGGAGALNQYLDRTVDLKMSRTSRRPLPAGRLQPRQALIFGLLCCGLGLLVLLAGANVLSAALALVGIIYYVVVYSMLLKPHTPANIVIGGGAGAIPPLVGWAAATGSLPALALLLFALVFFWTPAHFWALALLKVEDYRRAGIPMLPVIRGHGETRKRIVRYSLQTVAITLLMPVLGLGEDLFALSGLVLGAGLIGLAWKLLQTGGNRAAWRMYRYSSLYLAGVFLSLVADVLLTT